MQPTILTPENLSSPQSRARHCSDAAVNITQADATPLEGFQIMLRSASSERAAEIAREQIENHYLKTMTAGLTGDLAAQRAALVFAVVAGLQVMRQMIGLSALADADPEKLVGLLGPVLQQLDRGPAATPDNRPVPHRRADLGGGRRLMHIPHDLRRERH